MANDLLNQPETETTANSGSQNDRGAGSQTGTESGHELDAFLGKAFDPYTLFPDGDDLDMTKMNHIKVDDLNLRPDVFAMRLKRRASLRQSMEETMPDIDKAVAAAKRAFASGTSGAQQAIPKPAAKKARRVASRVLGRSADGIPGISWPWANTCAYRLGRGLSPHRG